MKPYRILKWVCIDCKWYWETLIALSDTITFEECPTCKSNNTQRIKNYQIIDIDM